jgi:hypothetical protein
MTPIPVKPPPIPIFILIPTLASGYLRKGLKPWPIPRPGKLPRRPKPPIPSFDRKALHEQVTRILRDTRRQRDEQIKAALP